MSTWSIKKSEHEKIEVSILSQPSTDEGYDWVPVQVLVNAGGFRGTVRANFLGSEIIKFRNELMTLNKNLTSPVVFETIEGQLMISLAPNISGHLKVTGELLDGTANCNKLTFSFDIDQSYLPATINELDKAVHSFNK